MDWRKFGAICLLIVLAFFAAGITFLGVCVVGSSIHNQIDPPSGRHLAGLDRAANWGLASLVASFVAFITAVIVGLLQITRLNLLSSLNFIIS